MSNVWFVYRLGTAADRGRPQRERASLSAIMAEKKKTGFRWLWESGPDHLVTQLVGAINAVGIAPSRLTGVARLGTLRPMSNRSPKNGDCIGRCSRTSAISRFRLPAQIRERHSVICPNKRQATL